MPFKLRSDYKPQGDQPRAIAELISGIGRGDKHHTLLGVTGSGKTFTVANVVDKVQKPTLVIAHNKTLAGQLYGEFKELFPENAVEFFVSYYDYYQPEAYVPSSDTYIEKDSTINDEIDRLRHCDARAPHAQRRADRRFGLLHLRSGHGGGVLRAEGRAADRRGVPAAQAPARPGRDPVRAQRSRLLPRNVPGEGRHHRDLPRLRGGARYPRRAARRHGGEHQGDRSPPATT